MTGKHRKINTVFDYDDALNALEEEHDRKAEEEKQQRELREKLVLQQEKEKKDAEALKVKADEIASLKKNADTLEKYIRSFDEFDGQKGEPKDWIAKCKLMLKNLEEVKEANDEKVSDILIQDGKDQFYLEKKYKAGKKLEELEAKLIGNKISSIQCLKVISDLCFLFQDLLGARKFRIHEKIKELEAQYKRDQKAFEKKYEATSPKVERNTASPTSPPAQDQGVEPPKPSSQSVANARSSTFARAGGEISRAQRTGQSEFKKSPVNKGGS
jgi:hypothetical protein